MEPLRFSRLRRMAKSAAHFAAYQDEDTASLRKGRALHSLLLGDARDEVVAVCPPGMKRDLRHKAYQEWLKGHEGAEILTEAEAASVRGMRQSIERHPRALELLEGVREHTEYWTWLGRACRGTPDVVSSRYLVELKTCRSSDPRQFPFEARRYHYHGQLAWYLNGLSIVRGAARIPSEICIVAIESTVPYPVTVFRVTDELLEQGERSLRLWMERLAVCEQSGVWPAYAESDVELGVYENDSELDLSGLEEVVAA
jgi:hypothetical protein